MTRRRSTVQQSFCLRSDGLARRVATGAGFQFIGIALRTLLTIGSTAILARLLTPSDFGYIAMATVVTEFASLLGAFGFTNVLIQRRTVNRLQLDTVFWATLGIGVALALLVFVFSFLSGWVFDDPLVGGLLRVLCLSFLINSLTSVPWVVLSRQLRFRTEFKINIAVVVIRTAAAVASALIGLGVWSLVVGALVGATASVVLNYIAVPYLPRWRFHLRLLTGTWRTSSGYFGNTLLYYLNTNLDLFLIGRHLGAAPLGYYQNARSLTDEIRARIAMPIQHVLFPAMSTLQSDLPRFRQLVLRAGRLLAAVVVPIGVGVSANSRELVLVLYGEQWSAMIPVMALFGLSAALRAATAIGSPLFNATDRVGLALRYNTVGTLLTMGGVLFALPHGIDAVAVAVALSSLYAVASLRAAFSVIGFGMPQLLQVLAAPALASAAMWLATAAVREVEGPLPAGLVLPLHVLLGAAVYLVSLHLMSRQYLAEFKQAGSLLVRRA